MPSELLLEALPRGGGAPLLPEEAAIFDLRLENRSPSAVVAVAPDGNLFTPTVRVVDERGALLFERSPADAADRVVGDTGPTAPAPPVTRALASGEQAEAWVNVWNYEATLPPGRYVFQASHRALPAAADRIVSAPVPFEIRRAGVTSVAPGYPSAGRAASLLAWSSAPRDGGGAQLLVRLSGFTGHRTVQQGATPQGAVPEGALVSVSARAPDAGAAWSGWIAVLSAGSVELLRHNMTFATQRTGRIPLPIDAPRPVPGFPDRGRAVLLATGTYAGSPALVGIVAPPDAPPGAAFSIPLGALPSRAACAFAASGPIALLFAVDDGVTSSLRRLDIDESGEVIQAERVVHETPGSILAVHADMRAGVPPSFLALEAYRSEHHWIALHRIPLAGPAGIRDLAPLAGWPGAPDAPLGAAEIAIETASADGAAMIALVDEAGSFHGGLLEVLPLLLPLRDGAEGKASFPHIAALARGTTFSCFTPDGALFHAGGE